MSKQTISATVDRPLIQRLDQMAKSSERTRSWIISKAIAAYLDELEDTEIALSRLHDARVSPKQLQELLRVRD